MNFFLAARDAAYLSVKYPRKHPMDSKQREIGEKLRKMCSSEAAEWLLENFPEDGCVYINKRTWKKEEQLRLAEHFLRRVPHANGQCYDSLLSIMALPKFIDVMMKYIPNNDSDRNLLRYYLYPVLQIFSKNDKDQTSIESIKSILL